MKTRKHLVWIAAFVLAGCSTAGIKSWLDGYAASPPCDLPQCNYKVTVTSCGANGIRPEYDPIVVKKGVHRLHWVITTPGYTFAERDGINFQGGPREFTNGVRVNPKEFSWTDTNAQDAPRKEFKYNVRILDSSGKTCDYDPSVVNE